MDEPTAEPPEVTAEIWLLWLALLLTALNNIFLRVSVFTNMVLSVARTIKIVRPFQHISLKRCIVAISCYPVLWVIIAIFDIYCIQLRLRDRLNYDDFDIYFYYSQIGNGILYFMFFLSYEAELALQLGSMVISFLIPVVVCFIACCILLHSIRKEVPNSDSAKNLRHVSVTVLLLTAMFLVCIGSSTMYFVATDIVAMKFNRYGYSIFFISFPLLNAILSPVIIMCRSKDLREKLLGSATR